MGPDPVVLLPPLLDHDPCLLQRVEDLPIQAFLPQLPIEALAVPVLPRTARLDIQGTGSQSLEPVPQLPGNKLRPIVGTDILRNPSPQHHLWQRLDHILDEVVAPDMIGSLRTKPDTGTVIEPQPSWRPLFLRNFQPLTPPEILSTRRRLTAIRSRRPGVWLMYLAAEATPAALLIATRAIPLRPPL